MCSEFFARREGVTVLPVESVLDLFSKPLEVFCEGEIAECNWVDVGEEVGDMWREDVFDATEITGAGWEEGGGDGDLVNNEDASVEVLDEDLDDKTEEGMDACGREGEDYPSDEQAAYEEEGGDFLNIHMNVWGRKISGVFARLVRGDGSKG